MTLYKTGAVNTYSGASSIQTAIMNSGPVQTTMTVYQDFLTYTSGIYVHTFGGLLGSHSVKILGWGTQGSVVYWICANTWGTSWGMMGYFWIAFGQCGIDSSAVAGTPVI